MSPQNVFFLGAPQKRGLYTKHMHRCMHTHAHVHSSAAQATPRTLDPQTSFGTRRPHCCHDRHRGRRHWGTAPILALTLLPLFTTQSQADRCSAEQIWDIRVVLLTLDLGGVLWWHRLANQPGRHKQAGEGIRKSFCFGCSSPCRLLNPLKHIS